MPLYIPFKTYGCRVYHNAAQTIANNTDTVLNFNSERFDVGSYHDTVTNNSRITVPTGLGGYYFIWLNMAFVANATGNRQAYIDINASTIITVYTNTNTGTWQSCLTIGTVYYLNAGDYLRAVVTQGSGGNLDVSSSGNYTPEFGAVLLGI